MRFFLSVFSALLLWVSAAAAHEVRPAVGDLTVENGEITLSIRLNAEALVSGVDLQGVANTNDTEASEEIDALRALPPEDLAAQFEQIAGQIIAGMDLRASEDAVPLSLDSITIDAVGNVELPRDSTAVFTGTLPSGADRLDLAWPAAYGTLILRQQGVEDGLTMYMGGGMRTGPIDVSGGQAQGFGATFLSYIPVGFDHILPKGLDHILFVLGLFFLTTQLVPLLWQVSAFTLAHTVTLALGALGLVNIPGSIVEPLIAASIVYVAVENLRSDTMSRWRPAVIFGFGLLHGLGFASVLGEFGLPQGQFVAALIGFNIGVEVGQLTVIAIAFLLVWLAMRVDAGEARVETAQITYGVLALAFVGLSFVLNGPGFMQTMGAGAPLFFWPLAAVAALCALSATNVDKLDAYRRFVSMPASIGIALVGAYWFVERVFL
ncbi:MAG: HupE/UreJ family protein [Paracoccaceae bacterium]|nr:HupE/UreJ family protein [Paracoccaceae bacterium]